MIVKMIERNSSVELGLSGLTLTVERYKHSVFGGPLTAQIIARASDEAPLWDLLERLRCKIEIYSDLGDCVWWGYLNEVQVTLERRQVTVSLDGMANSIAVAAEQMTAYTTDAGSVAEYGTKQLIVSVNNAGSAMATNAQAAKLAMARFPRVRPVYTKPTAQMIARLTCKGWFSTLDWKYVAVGKLSGDTGTMAGSLATTYGQFFSAVTTVTSSVSSSVNRDGKTKALGELLELMQAGTSNYRRLTAVVDRELRLWISEETAWSATVEYSEDENNNLYYPISDSAKVRKEICPVGIWIRQKDALPGYVDLTYLGDSRLIYADETEYEVATDKLTYTPRDIQQPWMLGRPIDG